MRYLILLVLLSSCTVVKDQGTHINFLGVKLNKLDSYDTKTDEVINENELKNVIFNSINNAKKTLFFYNYPSLNLNSTPLHPNTLVVLLKRARERGVKIVFLHNAAKRSYPFTDVVLREQLGSFIQNPRPNDRGYVPQGSKYLLVDDKVLFIRDPQFFPRWVNKDVDKQDVYTDWKGQLEIAMRYK